MVRVSRRVVGQRPQHSEPDPPRYCGAIVHQFAHEARHVTYLARARFGGTLGQRKQLKALLLREVKVHFFVVVALHDLLLDA